ncbi:MAG: GIY-YIG nuclease family protein [Pseudomonadota bacterium]
MGFVYFLQAGDGGPIKIGFASDPMQRARSLQTGNHEQVYLLATAPGSLQDEHGLHARFAHLNSRGEWFRPEPELMQFIAGVQWRERTSAQAVASDASEEGISRAQAVMLCEFVELTRILNDAKDLEYEARGHEKLDPEILFRVHRARLGLMPFLHADDGAGVLYGKVNVKRVDVALAEIESVHGHAVAYLRVVDDALHGVCTDCSADEISSYFDDAPSQEPN